MTTTAHESAPAARGAKTRPTHLVYRCCRCTAVIGERHDDAEVALRRAVATGALVIVHGCGDGGHGVAELVGTGPGRPFTSGRGERVSASYVLAVVNAECRGDWELARWAAREAAIARAREAWEAP